MSALIYWNQMLIILSLSIAYEQKNFAALGSRRYVADTHRGGKGAQLMDHFIILFGSLKKLSQK
jgi:hypothetical protein